VETFPADDDVLVLALGQDSGVAAGVDLTIHPDDDMLRVLGDLAGGDRRRARSMYFDSGLALWRTLRQVAEWRFGELGRVGKLLDFASGYGRVTRFMLRDLPPERVWVSDVVAAAVEFQRRQLGVRGFVSTARPEELVCDERFDCILVSSLFTHLPEGTFAPWLRRLWELLAPGGVLAFSVHDAGLLPSGRQLPAGGLLFAPSSESRALPGADYGSTWVSESFVRGALRAVAPSASLARIPRALANLQDLYVAVAEPEADFSGLGKPGAVQGFVEHCAWTPPDRLEVSGWVVDRGGAGPPVEVRAWIGGEMAALCRELSPRPDVGELFGAETAAGLGWRLAARVPGGPPGLTARLRLEAVAADGSAWPLAESTVEGALLRSARLQHFFEHGAHQRLQERHEALRQELERVVGGYESALESVRGEMRWQMHVRDARIAAMEASFFWKLRNRWFAVKRFLRLTREP
jgi:SAM-dependent methyltransferase